MGLETNLRLGELGLLPKDWPIVPLGQVADKITVGFVGSMAHLFVRTGVPLLRGQNVLAGTLDLSELRFISPDTHRQWVKSALRPGDVIMVRVGYPGTACVVPEDLGAANAASLVVIRPAQRALSSAFLVAFANSGTGKKQIDSFLVGGAQQVLNVGTAARFVLPLPPRDEQDAIAQVLSDINALLDAVERLIVKKRQIKQGIMQELLTGRKRLPGFGDEWRSLELRELGAFLKGSGVSRADAQSGALPCVRYGELYTLHHEVIRSFGSYISSEVAAGATRLFQGDILFAASGETKSEIGKCAAFVSDEEAYAGGDIVILRPKRADSRFLGYLLNMPEISRQKASKGQGDAVVHISASSLGTISICVPSASEQEAIAAVLEDIDTEIEALEAKLTKARQLKEGMRQALLTGAIRLPVEAAA